MVQDIVQSLTEIAIYLTGDTAIVEGRRETLASIANYLSAGSHLASQAEAEEGTDDKKLMTPLATAQAIAALGGGIEINAQADSYTLVADDVNKLVMLTKETAVNLTVPPAVFSAGDVIGLIQGGAGTVSVVAGEGVTVNSLNSALDLSGQFAAASLLCTASNTFLLYGGLA